MATPAAYRFPRPSLHKGDHRFDVSYSGLKTAVIHQREQFRDPAFPDTPANLAAAFQRTAVDIVVDKALLACRETGHRMPGRRRRGSRQHLPAATPG